MTLPSYLTVRIAVLLLAFAGQVFAGNPPLLTTGVEIGSSNERTALNRATRDLSSTVDVKIKNTSDRLLEAPLHAVISFTPQNGGNLAGLTMPNTPGGIGVAPYQTFYKDLSASIGNGLAAGAETTFSFTFERPAASTVTYAVSIRGIRNSDPEASIGGPYSGQQGAPLSFNAGASSDPDGDALTFTWDFGDGGTAGGAAPEHTYTSSGIYTVTLTVTDARGAAVSKETQVPISPPGIFALARTRTLDGNGHPLGDVTINQSGPDGSHPIVSDSISGFASLGGAPGEHTWSFERSGYLTSFRKSTLEQGQVKVVPFPWLTALNTNRTTLSLLTTTPVTSPTGRVTLTMPTGAFEQVQSVAITELHGQSLPLPLPFGWSPLAAFHLDMSGDSAVDIPASLKLSETLTPARTAVLARMDEAASTWNTESIITGTSSDILAAVLRKPGSYAVVIADTLPAGNPTTAQSGQPLPAGTEPTIAAEVTAIGQVNPATAVASLDPAKVTAQATVDFTNHTQPLASGAWFLADVGETYDLRDGQLLKTPDYDATFYAYQSPGDSLAPTATANFPLLPRLLYGPDQLTEAHIKVDVLSLNRFSGGIITPDGGKLSIPGIQVTVPAGAVSAPTAAEIRPLSPTNLAGFLGGFQGLLPFEINLPRLPDGSALDLGITQKLKPGSNFVLARCVSSTRESGLQPVLRLRSDAQGQLTSAEPATGPRLPGITSSGQYVIVQITDPAALVTGLVRKLGGSLLPGAIVRSIGEPWLSLTGNAGTFFTLAEPGQRTLTGTDPADGNSGQATATLADAAATVNVEIQTAATGPRVVSTTPAASAPRASNVSPITVDFSEPIQPGSFGATGVRLRDVSTDTDVPGSLSLDLTHRKATLLPLNPLAYATDYEIFVSNTLLDRQSLPIEGTLTFAFKTAPSPERPAGAQLVIYEPGAVGASPAEQELLSEIPGYNPGEDRNKVVAVGGVGIADSEVPVILVNETTGETATVMSKPDGSFSSFVEATEDDLVAAVFVNANGSRVSIPASRQKFDDGRTGLFEAGGILEAANNSPDKLQVIIEPNAIERRSTFKIDALTLSSLQALLAEAPLAAENKLLGGFQFRSEGDTLRASADVSFSISEVDLGIPPTVTPEESPFVLTAVVEIDGKKVYKIIDKMEYANGKLETHSPPFLGLIESGYAAIIRLGNGGKAVVTGWVTDGGEDDRTIAGATVFVRPDFTSTDLDATNVLTAGSVVGVSDQTGHFSLLAPTGLDPAKQNFQMSVAAISSQFPLQMAIGPVVQKVLQTTGGNDPQSVLNYGIARVSFNVKRTLAGSDDKIPPTINITVPRDRPLSNTDFIVRALATDGGSSISSLKMRVKAVTALPPLPVDQVQNTQDSTQETASTRLSIFKLRSPREAELELEVTAIDAAGNKAESSIFLPVGGVQSLPVQPEPDPSDVIGPKVLRNMPSNGESDYAVSRAIRLNFNEALDPGVLSRISQAVILTPSAGVPVATLTDGGTDLRLQYPDLKPGTNYALDLTRRVVDRRNNPHDQDPSTSMLDQFRLTFRTRPEIRTSLSQIENGAGIVGNGNFLASIDRGKAGSTSGKLRIHTLPTAISVGALLAEESLPPFPRDIVLIPHYDYAIRLSNGATDIRRDRNLVAIVGGTTGGSAADDATSTGQWIRVFDVSIPADPRQICTSQLNRSPVSAATKLVWSPPHLGYLDFGADDTSVNLLNLQWLILAHGFNPVPARGITQMSAGVDLNQDGDFIDTGETLPTSSNVAPIIDLVNGGLVKSYRVLSHNSRIYDFSMAFGGKLIGVVGKYEGEFSSTGGFYTTIAEGGLQLFDPANPNTGNVLTYDFPSIPQRVTLLVGARVEINGQLQPRNLALISAGNPDATTGKENNLTILDITDARHPVLLNEIRLPSDSGAPRSVQVADNGMVVVSCINDVLFLDQERLAAGAPSGAALHPAIKFRFNGMGSGTRSFYTDGFDQMACSQGQRSIAISSSPGTYDLRIHHPGSIAQPGPIVSAVLEDAPENCLAYVNDDFDGTAETPPPAGSIADRDMPTRDAHDDDLVAVDFPAIAYKADAISPVRVKVTVSVTPLPSSGPQITGRVALINEGGLELKRSTNTENSTTFESGQGQTDTAFFATLTQRTSKLFLDSTRPSGKIEVKAELFDGSNNLVGTDVVSFAAVKATITRIWSDQFHAGRRSNSMPNNAGAAEQSPPESQKYILMGNRADNKTYVGGELSLVPDIPALRSKFRFRLVTAPFEVSEPMSITEGTNSTEIPPGKLVTHIYGTSSYDAGGEFSVVGDEEDIPLSSYESETISKLRIRPYTSPGTLSSVPPFIERFLVGGIDDSGDGTLDASEAVLACEPFGGNQYGGIGFHRGELVFHMEGGVRRYKEPHFKVVPRSLALSQQTYFGTLLGFVEAGNFITGAVLNGIRFGVNGITLGTAGTAPFEDLIFLPHFMTFVTGTMPTSSSNTAPQLAPDSFIHDFERATRSNRLHGDFGTGPTISAPCLNHSVGEFDAHGRRRVPVFRYQETSRISSTVAHSGEFRAAIVQNMKGDDEFLVAMRTAAQTAAAAGQRDFSIPFRRTSEQMPVPGDYKNNFLAHPDLWGSIGGFRIGDVSCIVNFRIDLLPGQPYQPSQTECFIQSLDGYFELSDLYDWELDVNPFAALISAGNGTYGSGGMAFLTLIPYHGLLYISDGTTDPSFSPVPYSIK